MYRIWQRTLCTVNCVKWQKQLPTLRFANHKSCPCFSSKKFNNHQKKNHLTIASSTTSKVSLQMFCGPQLKPRSYMADTKKNVMQWRVQSQPRATQTIYPDIFLIIIKINNSIQYDQTLSLPNRFPCYQHFWKLFLSVNSISPWLPIYSYTQINRNVYKHCVILLSYDRFNNLLFYLSFVYNLIYDYYNYRCYNELLLILTACYCYYESIEKILL